MTDDRRLDGIDKSHWNKGPHGPRPDWPAVIASGVRLIIIKATDGLSSIDPTFHADWVDLRSLVPVPRGVAGAPWLGVYHFRRNVDTVAQVQFCRATVGPLRVGECVAWDCEGATAGTYGDQRAICAVGGQAFDRVSIRYGNDTSWSFETAIKWTARYRAQKPAYPCALWQYGGAMVPGIVGPVDANEIMDAAALARACGITDTGDDVTAEEHAWLEQIHTLMTTGATGYGVQPVAPEVSRIGRMVRNMAVKLGVQVEPANP